MLSEANTKVGGRLGMKRCDPSSCRARSASAVFKTFVLHPKNTFATKSAPLRHERFSGRRPLPKDESTLLGDKPMFDFCFANKPTSCDINPDQASRDPMSN
jgi:hypothetical protein